MERLGLVDLQILHLGIKKNGRFDENDLENSDLRKLGVGRILDQLASLKEKKLIDMNADGSFSITNKARHSFWDKSIPLGIRILKILEIKSQPIEKISEFLVIPEEQIENEIESLRKKQLVLMSPLRNEKGLLRMFEILPEGIEELERAQKEVLKENKKEITSNQEISGMIIDIIRDIKNSQDMSLTKQDALISKLSIVKQKLEESF